MNIFGLDRLQRRWNKPVEEILDREEKEVASVLRSHVFMWVQSVREREEFPFCSF